MTPRPLAVVMSLSLLLIQAHASASGETVYRCGAERNVYRAEPCAGGKAVDVTDEPGDQRRQEALALARRDAALARQLERERVQREARATPSLAIGIRGERGTPIEPTAGFGERPPGEKKKKRKAARRRPPEA